MESALVRRRLMTNRIAMVLATIALVFGLFWVAWILWTTIANGLPALHLSLFTRMTPAAGEEGGLLTPWPEVFS